MRKTPISFLLGAGFSKPAGYPLASEINSRFVGLKESDISIHSDGSARFNNSNPNPNDWFTGKEERQFAEQILDYHCNQVTTPDSFHYETFYDWYQALRNNRTEDAVANIAAALKCCSPDELRSNLYSFNNTFEQLVSWLVGKRYPELYPRSYLRFVKIVENLSHEHVLHFHTLNHDMFIEDSLSRTMEGTLADGFTELGSPYYGTLWRKVGGPNGGGNFCYKVRLPYFSGEFNSCFNLYKLHGSIDQYVFDSDERQIIKDKYGIDTGHLCKEVKENGGPNYEHSPLTRGPHFLSGAKFKIDSYNFPYYKRAFECFTSNLEHSNSLIVIGYGFKDEGINDFLQKHFLSRNGKRLLIVDVEKPDLPFGEIASDCNTRFFAGGVTDFDAPGLERAAAG